MRNQLNPEPNHAGERYLGLHLVVGFILALACGILFKLIADEVFETPDIRSADEAAELAAQNLNSPALTTAMRFITFFGNAKTIILFSVITGYLIFRVHSRRRFYAFIAIMGGGGLLNLLLKDIFQRARPDAFEPLVGYHGYSFPSGHAMGATLFFGSLAYLIFIARNRSPVLRAAGVVLCVLAILLISLSRVYLGVHYLSDIGAGIVAGLGWIGICISGTEAWVRSQRRIKNSRSRNKNTESKE